MLFGSLQVGSEAGGLVEELDHLELELLCGLLVVQLVFYEDVLELGVALF